MRQAILVFGIVLAAGAPASADDKACLECHAMIQRARQETSGHGTVACAACHIEHKQPVSGKPGGYYLSATPPALCAGCHDTGDAKLQATHRGQPFGKARCTRCHEPHGSANAHLIRGTRHAPFASGSCDSCHLAPENGAVKLKKAAGELCLSCHANLAAQLSAAPRKHTLLAANPDACLECHDPHTSSLKALAKASAGTMCRTCHAEIGKKEFVHEPAKDDCTLCHNPHAGFKANLRAESNGLCLECHAVAARSRFEGNGVTRLFGGQVTLPPRHYQNLKLLDLNNDRGHPVSNHPVLRSPDKDWPAVSCTVCHSPHGADKSAPMLLTESESPLSLCQRCHK